MEDSLIRRIREVVDGMKMARNYRTYLGMVQEDGGPGSGNFNHKGVPGQLGGSAPGGGKGSGGGSSSSKKSGGGESSEKGGSEKKSSGSSGSSKSSGSSNGSKGPSSSSSAKVNSKGNYVLKNLTYKEMMDIPEGSVVEIYDEDYGKNRDFVSLGGGEFESPDGDYTYNAVEERTWSTENITAKEIRENLFPGSKVETKDGRVWEMVDDDEFMDVTTGETKSTDELYSSKSSEKNGGKSGSGSSSAEYKGGVKGMAGTTLTDNPEKPAKPNYTKCVKLMDKALTSSGAELLDDNDHDDWWSFEKGTTKKDVASCLVNAFRAAGYKADFEANGRGVDFPTGDVAVTRNSGDPAVYFSVVKDTEEYPDGINGRSVWLITKEEAI